MTDDTQLSQLVSARVASRIFERDTTVFAAADALDVQTSILNRLGWLTAPAGMAAEIATVETVTSAIRTDGLTDVYLLGMGGSSLCAEVLRDVPLPRDQRVKLDVLDTTDEYRVRKVTDALAADRSLFIVASKSGSTIEVTSLEHHFRSVLDSAGVTNVGRHFVAITDPGTSLVTHAERAGYRHVFINPPDIGGRYSALSLFGLVPAALLGLDITTVPPARRHVGARRRLKQRDKP